MSNLTDIQAAQSVKVIGANTSGVESTPVQSTTAGDLYASDALSVGGTQGLISVGTTQTAARVSGSNYSGRKILIIYNTSSQDVYWGFNGVLSTTGDLIPKNGGKIVLSVRDNVDIYLIVNSGSHSVRIVEGG